MNTTGLRFEWFHLPMLNKLCHIWNILSAEKRQCRSSSAKLWKGNWVTFNVLQVLWIQHKLKWPAEIPWQNFPAFPCHTVMEAGGLRGPHSGWRSLGVQTGGKQCFVNAVVIKNIDLQKDCMIWSKSKFFFKDIAIAIWFLIWENSNFASEFSFSKNKK